MKYSNWAPGYPINSSATNCMLLDISNGLWYSESCFYSTSFVCEIYSNNTYISTIYPPSTNYPTTTTTTTTTKITTTTTTTTTTKITTTTTTTTTTKITTTTTTTTIALKTTTLPQNSCGNRNWFLIGNQCIYFDLVVRNWSDASSACRSLGGVLVTVFNQKDEDFLYAQAQNIPFFIGLNDQARIGTWVWDQPVGKTLTLSDTKYTNWANGQPDTSDPTQRCVVDQEDIGWIVCSCELSAFSVCGKPAII